MEQTALGPRHDRRGEVMLHNIGWRFSRLGWGWGINTVYAYTPLWFELNHDLRGDIRICISCAREVGEDIAAYGRYLIYLCPSTRPS